ncbi:MAG: 3-deoxy-manno-octulosonate cytidylyltransferase [Candidatus Omnitrophica bacterium]|nr:3-deoxy-manno-octulosonate cytidylyltransferase [Candidatus Omnitrophota bacterium]
MKIAGIIPARYKSSRFPGKPLVLLLGKPMVIWVVEIAAKALGKDNVFVATDDDHIARVVQQYGYRAVMTSDSALTGTDRLYEASRRIKADIYINIQGDEPLLSFRDIVKVLECKKRFPREVVNGMCRLKHADDPRNINFPKVITTEDLKMVYMSRLPVPGFKASKNAPKVFWRQVCIYAMSREELTAFGRFGRKSELERMEDIEMLRFLELGVPIRMIKLRGSSYAVDVPGDVKFVSSILKKRAA